MKKRLLVVLACSILSFTSLGQSGQRPTDIAIGTAAAGGAWYPIGAAMADIIASSDLGIQASVQTTGGGIENSKLVNDGDCEIAINISFLAYNAYNGIAPYPRPMTNVRSMFGGLSVGVMQVVVLANSPIQRFADLKGKKVAVGPAGGGAITTLTACLEMEGVKYTEISPSYVSYDEGVTMMTDGNIDAAIVYGGIPTAAVKTLEAAGKNFRLIGLTEEERQEILKNFPYFVGVDVGTELYGLPEVVRTVGTPNIVMCSASLSDEIVYEMCKLFFEEGNLEKIRNSQPSARELTLETGAIVPIEWHPGAERFFREKGLLK